jgi:hypothetical protein
MERIFKLFIILCIVVVNACAPAYKTTRLQNFSEDYPQGVTSDVVKAHITLKSIVIMSFYDGTGEKNVPQFILKIDSIDDAFIYGKLEYSDFIYHLSGDKNFEVRELKNNNQRDSNAVRPPDPLEVLHIYTRFNNLKEGDLKLDINEIYALDVHNPAMKAGGKTAIAGGAVVTVATVVTVVLAIAAFSAFIALLSAI